MNQEQELTMDVGDDETRDIETRDDETDDSNCDDSDDREDCDDALRQRVIARLLHRPELARYRRFSRYGRPFILPKHWTALGIDAALTSALRQAGHNGENNNGAVNPEELAEEIALGVTGGLN